MKSLLKPALILVICFAFNYIAFPQEAIQPRPSPLAISTFKNQDIYIKITYGRPHKNNRIIFGDLVPYGIVWRTGANEATEMTITKDIYLAGNKLPSGTYTIFSIPDKEKWTIIINTEVGQWGAYSYDKSKDLLRFDVPVILSEITYEPFTIEFSQQDESVDLIMIWDKTKVIIPVKFTNN